MHTRLTPMRSSVASGNDVVHADDLFIGKVRDILADAAGGDGGQHGVVVHDLGTRLVDDAHAVFHLGKRLGIEHMERLVRIRHVDADIVRLGINAIEVHLVLDIARETPRRIHGQIRVVTADVHAEVHGGVGNERADCAEADDTQRLAHELRAGEL